MKISFKFAVCVILFCANISCINSANRSDANDTASNSGEQMIEYDPLQIQERVKEIWFKIPEYDQTSAPPLIPFLSSSLRGDYEKVYAASMKAWDIYNSGSSGDEALDCAMGLGECIFNLWGGQDPDPDGKFNFKEISRVSDNKVRINLVYYNGPSPEDHQLELVYENGQWLLDNFDDLKETLKSIINDPNYAPYLDAKAPEQINSGDLEMLNTVIGSIYTKPEQMGSSDTFDDETMKRIKAYGTESLIRAVEKNYTFARARCSRMNPFVGPNLLVADIFDCGTDELTKVKFMGFSLGSVRKNGNNVEADVMLKVNIYDSEDGEHFTFYKTATYPLKMRFDFSDRDGKSICKLDDIMFLSGFSEYAVPLNKWVKKEMENNKFFKPALVP